MVRGGHGTGSKRCLGRQEVWDRGDRRGEGERGYHKNTLPLGMRVLGHVRLYGERGGEGQKRDGHHENPRGTKSNERIVGHKRRLGTQRLGLEWPLSGGGTG